MITSEFLRVLYVVGMVLGIRFCIACILMCVLIGVMVIRACVTYDDDDIWDTQPRQASKEKEGREAQSDEESEENWSDREEKEDEDEKVWLVSTPDGAWVKTEGKKVYMRVGEGDESEI